MSLAEGIDVGGTFTPPAPPPPPPSPPPSPEPSPSPSPSPSPEPAPASTPSRPAPAPTPSPPRSQTGPTIEQKAVAQPAFTIGTGSQAEQLAVTVAKDVAQSITGQPLTPDQQLAVSTAALQAVTPGPSLSSQGEADVAAAATAAIVSQPDVVPVTPIGAQPGAQEAGGPPGLRETGVLTLDEVEALWVAAGGDVALKQLAGLIATCESGRDTSKIHNTAYPDKPGYEPPLPNNQPEYSVGLWQVNIYAHHEYTEADMLNGYLNARAIVASSGDGRYFAQTNVGCYRVASGQPADLTAGNQPVTSASAITATGPGQAWTKLMEWLAGGAHGTDEGPPGYTAGLSKIRSNIPQARLTTLWSPSE